MRWVRGLVIPDVAEVHAAYRKCMTDADALLRLARGGPTEAVAVELVAELQKSYETFNVGLRTAAQKAAEAAQKGMVERLQRRERPETGSIPPLRDLVEARALRLAGNMETGAVGIGNVDLLNRAINPHSRGYGPYWRAIEYGTGAGEVASQIGRILYGSFVKAGGGDPSAPQAQFAGGGGPHPVFISGGIQGGPGERTIGMGTIGKEITAKHFIKYGADGAAVQWRADVQAAQSRAIQALAAVKLGRS